MYSHIRTKSFCCVFFLAVERVFFYVVRIGLKFSSVWELENQFESLKKSILLKWCFWMRGKDNEHFSLLSVCFHRDLRTQFEVSKKAEAEEEKNIHFYRTDFVSDFKFRPVKSTNIVLAVANHGPNYQSSTDMVFTYVSLKCKCQGSFTFRMWRYEREYHHEHFQYLTRSVDRSKQQNLLA